MSHFGYVQTMSEIIPIRQTSNSDPAYKLTCNDKHTAVMPTNVNEKYSQNKEHCTGTT